MNEKENLQLGGKYWDLFDKRAGETVAAIQKGELPQLRRLSLHITNRCNMKCSYCNEHHTAAEMKFDVFNKLVCEYEVVYFTSLVGNLLWLSSLIRFFLLLLSIPISIYN